MTKQRVIVTILHQNNKLLKLDQYYNKNTDQETIVRNSVEKVEKLSKISQESQKQIIGVDESIGKGTKRKNMDQIIPYNPKNNLEVNPWKVKNTKKVLLLLTRWLKTLLTPEFQEQLSLRWDHILANNIWYMWLH